MDYIWIVLITGVFIGAVAALLIFLVIIGGWYIGDLREDRSDDPEKPYYFMEISNGASWRIRKNKFVLLKIRRENYLNQ